MTERGDTLKQIIYVCDKCKRQIKEPNTVLDDLDLCEGCMKELRQLIKNWIEPQKPEKKLDDGKMKALRDAGWTFKDIAEEVHCSPQTVINHLNAMAEKGEAV